ncbi:hypothetical protein PCC7424_0974 [Gloeothece citriformis PCC 7424]|uniref:Type I restriction modification DNA specificity domain-containing protein n=1 Tax=Gloeothece citriformis (strain PCC 7424) TaxID=65393 RepID=B7KIM3_GLOC7|nr:hypothetical protein [Gloeothece citriformis]ACK69429.1 hypothetical protein PCC7424_0974 [Gloeothece citriformis PCC 7424]
MQKQSLFKSKIIDFSSNKDLRFSYKFHNKVAVFLKNFLVNQTTKKIKNFTCEPIILGKGIKPKEYDDEGEYFYFSMADIKQWKFNPEDCRRVNETFYLKNINKTVQLNDILLARSGEGTIGKVALIDNDEWKGVFADFVMRIRLKGYNPLLAYFYFQSDLFQYLVYTHKKGLGNNTNIFPSQIQDFPILDLCVEKQEMIIHEIKTQLEEQAEIQEKINMKKAEIIHIIEIESFDSETEIIN